MNNENRSERPRVVLHGLGGTGKTQLAIEYAYRFQAHYKGGIYWINATQSWKHEIVAIAKRIGLRPSDPDDRDYDGQMVSAFDRYLNASDGDALIILDSSDSPLDVTQREVGPKIKMTSFTSHLLITTRLWDLPQGFEHLPVDVVSIEDARAILQESRSDPKDQTLIDEVCRLLGYLPLALDLAAAALSKFDDMPMENFLDHLRRSGVDRIADEAGALSARLASNQMRVAAILDWHWAQLRDENAKTLMVLSSAYGEGASIPIARLRILSGWLDDPRQMPSQRPLKRAMSELFRASLLQDAGRKRIRIHALVREYIRRKADHTTTLEEGASRLLSTYSSPEDICAEVRVRGFDEAVGDLQNTCVVLPHSSASLAELHRLARLFTIEAGHMREWDPERFPAYIIQHLRERSFHEHEEQLCLECDAWLRRFYHFATLLPWRYPMDPTLIRSFAGHQGSVSKAVVLRGGEYALSASSDRTLRLWDLESGDTIRVFEGHADFVTDVVLLPDGVHALSASADKTLRLWNIHSGESQHCFSGHRKRINSVCVVPGGQLAVSAASDKTLRLWDLETRTELTVMRGHTDAVLSVQPLPDGIHVLSASADQTLMLWNIKTGTNMRVLRGHTGAVTASVPFADGTHALSGAADSSLRLWDLHSGKAIRVLTGHTGGVIGVSLLTDGVRAVSTSWDNTLRLWDVTRGSTVRVYEGHSGRVNSVFLLPDQRRMLSASWDHTLRLWNLEGKRIGETPQGHLGAWVRALAVSFDGQRAVSASSDKTLRLWDVEMGQCLRVFRGHLGKVNCVAFLNDGTHAISGSADATLKSWNLATGNEKRAYVGHDARVNSVAVLADGRRFISASWDRTLRVWDIESGRTLRTYSGHAGRVTSVAILDDGIEVLSGADDRTIRLWNVNSGHTRLVMEGHLDAVTALALSSQRGLSGSRDRTLRLWDLATGSCLRVLRGHTAWVNNVAFLAGGRLAVSVGEDKTLRLWDLDQGNNLAVVHMEESLHSLAVDQHSSVLVGGASGTVRRMRLYSPITITHKNSSRMSVET